MTILKQSKCAINEKERNIFHKIKISFINHINITSQVTTDFLNGLLTAKQSLKIQIMPNIQLNKLYLMWNNCATIMKG